MLKKITSILVLGFLMLGLGCTKATKTYTEDDISIVPQPSKLSLHKQSFVFSENTTIYTNTDAQKPAATFLSDMFKKAAGFDFTNALNNVQATITFIEDTTLNTENYQLEITPDNINIKASDAAGYFYAVQTLRQLLPVAIELPNSQEKNWSVPSLNITDGPRFSWRGMHMDFSRHFFALDEVKIFLDYMALYKLNKYHMHLTDDQGWRIEIKKYPLLTEKGAWRVESSHDKGCKELAKTDSSYTIDEQHYQNRDGKKMYGGFFTQEQIKEIIAYAAERQIEVIPEIDMPGHFKAAIDNYPFLSCTNEAGWGETFSVPACLGKETSYTFVKDILAEVAALFPSEYIHIGGDEVNTQSWKECPLCQKKIKDYGLKDEHELQSYFNKDIEAFLTTKGKKLLGWDEIAEGGLSEEATMMWWRNWAPNTRQIAADNGNDIIITPDFEYYFDFQNDATPLEKVYRYEPIPEDFTPTQAKHIIGVQANLWSEYIPNFKRLQYQTFPRMLALAETGWTGKDNKDFDRFTRKMDLQYERMDAMDIQYYIPPVTGLKDKIAFLDKATITLETPLDHMDIYYTTDGSRPSKTSKKYKKPLEFSKTTTLSTIAYRGNTASEVKSALIEKQAFMNPIEVNPLTGKINRWTGIKQFNIVEDIVLPENADFEPVSTIALTGYEDADHISMVFKGYFFAEEDGLYEFATKSDDGSLLYIGDKLVVDNGGNHSAILREGMVALKKGWHPLTLRFHEATGGSELTVWYTVPAKEKQPLGGSVLGYLNL